MGAHKLKHGMAKGLYAGKHPAWKPGKPEAKRHGKAKPGRGGFRK